MMPTAKYSVAEMMAPKKILIVDDDVEFADMVREYLQPEGFAVELAHDGSACFAAAPESMDIIVLDVMLPGQSGFEILKELRRRSLVPVLMLTARDTDTDRIVGLEIGADDYVPKPVNPRELVARIRAILRRSATAGAALDSAADLVVGDVHLNAASRTAWCDGRLLDLTTAEFNLLEYLLRKPGKIIPRDELSAAAFDRRDASKIDRNVDTLVSKLRRKLGPAREFEDRIKTIRNVGYLYALTLERPAGTETRAAHPL
jgi:DNA-binding response OmpR family regulator